MHKSVLRELTIDCDTDDLEEAAEFWSEALGRKKVPGAGSMAESYFTLATRPDEIEINIQRVEHPSRT